MNRLAKSHFAYIRVSTVRQGQTGTSLEEQRAAIFRHAQKNDLNIVQEFEEKETAAKRGRPVFSKMIKAIKRGEATGIVMHKIDRSARNLRDWAELMEMIDKGLEVHFANENLDLDSRGGRLSADIQAVVAADYIRNLKEEVKKGLYGRLKQGLYPFPAPVGYQDNGPAKAKTIDPIHGPLVKKAFELYLTGNYSITSLADDLYKRGLRNQFGRKVSRNGLFNLLHNPFYIGRIRMKKTQQIFSGVHRPLITDEKFRAVQDMLSSNRTCDIDKREIAGTFVFRRRLECSRCERLLTGEIQKEIRYYRCHTRKCAQKGIREDAIEKIFCDTLLDLKFSDVEIALFERWLQESKKAKKDQSNEDKKRIRLEIEKIANRLDRLTDAYLDGVLDEDVFVAKKEKMTEEKDRLDDQINDRKVDFADISKKMVSFFELSNSAYLRYKSGNIRKKREFMDSIVSNFSVKDKSVLIKLKTPFDVVQNRGVIPSGGARRGRARTVYAFLSRSFRYFEECNAG
ncbi:MAG: recombinase family protein [Acidobacteria bacterium]|nr:MAG: recombinase family protein [Acidobacteriota bacterium]REJ98281.1 MAG: recombinase family protein [Acidobacteriota bacterium]REK17025.1 MAG: recombinase family protein [Acidobacteriota bacterium]REK42935.1 MAG: recombinase family protein [Acidobacteriota bacterium]